MQKNIGKPDRIIRFLLALVLFGFAFWTHSLILAGFGLFTLYEAFASWCVLYQFLGINSCKIKK